MCCLRIEVLHIIPTERVSDLKQLSHTVSDRSKRAVISLPSSAFNLFPRDSRMPRVAKVQPLPEVL